MDGISSAFVIKFFVRELPTTFSPIASMVEIDGDLEILIGHEVAFSETFIALGELAGQLNNWVKGIQNGILVDFVYNSMDYGESPIFSLELVQHIVTFRSSWYPNLEKEVQLEHLILGVLKFLEEFRAQIPQFEFY